MSKNKYSLIAAGLVLVALGAGVHHADVFDGINAKILNPAYFFSADYDSKPSDETTRLFFVGDIMLDRGVEDKIVRYGGGDFYFPFQKMAGALRKSDLLFGNLEGPLSDQGHDLGKLYSFRMRPEALNGLVAAGFDVLSLANNHSDDWGRDAIADTRARLEKAGIAAIGTGNEEEAYTPRILEINGTKFSFLAFTDFSVLPAEGVLPGAAIADEERIISALNEAERKSDVSVISFHFGEEYMVQPTLRQRRLVQIAVDHGADLIVGHHPHVVGPLEFSHGVYVAYSLGNFVFDQNFSIETMTGALLEVMVRDRRIVQTRLVPVAINSHFQPELNDEML